jgi:hypothetical protein
MYSRWRLAAKFVNTGRWRRHTEAIEITVQANADSHRSFCLTGARSRAERIGLAGWKLRQANVN